MTTTAPITTIPGPRPCSIHEDGHRAPATHKVLAWVYDPRCPVRPGRLFCAECAEAEVALLRDLGFEADVSGLAVRIPPRKLAVRKPEPQPSLLAVGINPFTGEEEEIWGVVGHASRPITTDILATPRFGYVADRNAKKIAFWTRQAHEYRAAGETGRADMAMQVVAELKGAR